MLISNYGLFWRRSDVFWGSQGRNPGHLKGVRINHARSPAVDFRDQQGVYVLYDEAFQIVYVGQAGAGVNQRLFDRLRNHQRDQLADRWARFSWFGIRRITKDHRLRAEARAAHATVSEILDHIEAILIFSAEPRHNRQGGKFGNGVAQFAQYRDPGLGPDASEMMRDVWERAQA